MGIVPDKKLTHPFSTIDLTSPTSSHFLVAVLVQLERFLEVEEIERWNCERPAVPSKLMIPQRPTLVTRTFRYRSSFLLSSKRRGRLEITPRRPLLLYTSSASFQFALRRSAVVPMVMMNARTVAITSPSPRKLAMV